MEKLKFWEFFSRQTLTLPEHHLNKFIVYRTRHMWVEAVAGSRP